MLLPSEATSYSYTELPYTVNTIPTSAINDCEITGIVENNEVAEINNNYIKCYNEDDIKQFKNTAYGALNAFIDLINHKEPVRVTTNYYENSWNKLINGHPYIDTFHKMLG